MDVCWHQRDPTPASLILSSGPVLVSSTNNDPLSEAIIREADATGRAECKRTRDELVKIREGFDAWLAAFRKSRPHRDVIWRVGKKESDQVVALNVVVLQPVTSELR